jgi:hypothetical protein
MEACYGGTGVMERSCAVARGIDTNNGRQSPTASGGASFGPKPKAGIGLFSFSTMFLYPAY